ncbi:MAG: hypothetical protein ABJ246_12095 [Paracoccaceae bacterium]
MADYPNTDIQRSDGVSGRGILISILVILAVLVGLAILGSNPAQVDPTGISSTSEQAPAAVDTTPAPVPIE